MIVSADLSGLPSAVTGASRSNLETLGSGDPGTMGVGIWALASRRIAYFIAAKASTTGRLLTLIMPAPG